MDELLALLPSYLHLFAAIAYLLLGVYVFLNNARSRLHRIGAGFFACLSVWSGSFFIVHLPFTPRSVAVIMLQFGSTGGLFYPLLLLHLALYLSSIRRRIYRVLIVVPVVLSMIVLVSQLSGLAPLARITQRTDYGWHVEFSGGFTYVVYAVYSYLTAAFIILVLGRLAFAKREATLVRRIQARFLLFGGISAYALAYMADVVQKRIGLSQNFSTDVVFIIWAGALFYAILRFRLFRLSPQSATEQIVASIPELIFLVDVNGLVTYANDAGCRFAGIASGDMTGTPFRNLPRLHLNDHAISLFDHESIQNLSLSAKDSYGVERNFIVAKAPVNDGVGERLGYVFLYRDITDFTRVEEELLRSQKLESLAMMAGGVGHDLNNMLCGVVGYLELAESVAPPDSEIAEYLHAVEASFPRMKDLTRQLLLFSKSSSAKLEAQDIALVIQNAVSLATSGTSVVCDLDVADDIPRVVADEGKITQVISNLCVNAIQAMDGRGRFAIRVKKTDIGEGIVPGLLPGTYVEIDVTDNGPGVPEDIAASIFDPFFTTKKSGSGLGLATSYLIMKQHGGLIRLGEYHRGARFELFLRAASGRSKRVQIKEPHAGSSFSGECLIMDDDDQVRKVLSEMLSKLGFSPLEAKSGEHVLETLESDIEIRDRLRFLILDRTVRGGLGAEDVIDRVHDMSPGIPVILATGYDVAEFETTNRKNGFSGVLEKPFRIGQIRTVLGNVLAE